ncbi:hypothetical protein FRC10_009302 [Ceratobasidium sp. 414]|nr:hypothetical protein FRC10_009302 [Ceratobasidium sp. 414]
MPHQTHLSRRELSKQCAFEHHIYLSDEGRMEGTLVDGTSGRTITKRALHGFVLLRQEEPDFVQPLEINERYWADFSVQGYAATLEGEEGLFVQTGHWLESVVKYQLVKIDRIQSLELGSDPAFRGGICGYLASPCGSISLSTHPPCWWPKDAQRAWLRLRGVQHPTALPSVQYNVATHDTPHYPCLPAASSSRPGLTFLPIGSNPADQPAPGKRAIVDPQEPGAAGDGTIVPEVKRRRSAKPFCLEDPEVLRLAIPFDEEPNHATGMGERGSALRPDSSSWVVTGGFYSWVLGKAIRSSAAITEEPGDDSETRPPARQHAADPARQERKANPTNNNSADV